MNYRSLGLYLSLALAFGACAKSPVSPTGAITVSVPTLASPADGAQIANLTQPVTLAIKDATTTDPNALVTYTFEVAGDAAFANKIVSRDVPEASGQTSLKLDILPAGQTYFWHVRTNAGGTPGTFSATITFVIGPAIVIQPPAPTSPASGATVASAQPTVTVSNASRAGPVGTIGYLFEIATDSAFANIVARGTVAEGSTQTSFTPSSNLSFKTTYYWHARATDITNNISSAFSAARSFVTPDPSTASQAGKIAVQLGITLWPGAQPPGTLGNAILGDNWEVQTLHHLPSNTYFQSPTPEMLRLFDLLDRGFDPNGAIDWMNGNGYPTNAQWYPGPEKAVIGLLYVYLAARDQVVVHGIWDLVLKAE